jgi:membrane-associated protein
MALDVFSVEQVQKIAQDYGYWAVFLGILLENIGFPVPGETVTLVGGFLAGNHQLNYWVVLLSAALGATIGGNIGYWIGRKGGWPLLVKVGRWLRIGDDRLQALRQQFSENAAKAVFLGRFIALLRVFASPLAGIAQMPYPQFFLYNLLGAVAWASIMVTLSYVAGKFISLEDLAALVSRLGLVTVAIAVAWFVIPGWLEARQEKAKLVLPDFQAIAAEDAPTSPEHSTSELAETAVHSQETSQA